MMEMPIQSSFVFSGKTSTAVCFILGPKYETNQIKIDYLMFMKLAILQI